MGRHLGLPLLLPDSPLDGTAPYCMYSTRRGPTAPDMFNCLCKFCPTSVFWLTVTLWNMWNWVKLQFCSHRPTHSSAKVSVSLPPTAFLPEALEGSLPVPAPSPYGLIVQDVNTYIFRSTSFFFQHWQRRCMHQLCSIADTQFRILVKPCLFFCNCLYMNIPYLYLISPQPHFQYIFPLDIQVNSKKAQFELKKSDFLPDF